MANTDAAYSLDEESEERLRQDLEQMLERCAAMEHALAENQERLLRVARDRERDLADLSRNVACNVAEAAAAISEAQGSPLPLLSAKGTIAAANPADLPVAVCSALRACKESIVRMPLKGLGPRLAATLSSAGFALGWLVVGYTLA